MTRLTVAAAALVAGMTTFAVNAQEAPDMSFAAVAGMAAKSAEAKVPEAKEKPAKRAGAPAGRSSISAGPDFNDQGMVPAVAETAAQPERKVVAADMQDRGMATVPEASLDMTRTASVGKRASPSLKAVARNQTGARGDAKEVAATAKARDGGKYGAIISRYAASYGVPVALAHAVISVESNYRANARGKAGEIGLMQIKPATARAMGYSGGAAGLYNPDTNIRFGMKYLAMAHKLGGGSTCGTILKYNAGHGARRMNPVSAAYCRKVKRHLGA